jgi:hypothetical protein
MDSPAGESCKECDVGVGCKIYDIAPKDCLDFECAYSQMEKVHINMRPDKCGIIFERIGKNIFLGTINTDDTEANEDIKGQINSFIQDEFSVILKQMHKMPIIIPTKGYTPEEVWETYQQEIKK